MTDHDITALIKRLRNWIRMRDWPILGEAADALEACQAERDGIKLDLNDCNNERVRWKARAEKAEAALAQQATL